MRAGYVNPHVKRLEAQVFRSLHRLGAQQRSLVVAVSGGADSMVLLHALHRVQKAAKLRLQVATVDHQLRAQSGDDCQMVEQASERLKLPCARLTVEVDSKASGLESRARDARYAALQSFQKACSADFVATAHTASDQAETLLMRLARGSALKGAQGIAHHRTDDVIRPLLGCSRGEVLGYASALKLPFVTDSMNADAQFFRVRVRESVLPALTTAAGFEVAPLLARFCAHAQDDEQLLSSMAQVALVRVSLSPTRLDGASTLGLLRPIRRRVLALFLEQNQLLASSEAIASLEGTLESGRAVTLSSAMQGCFHEGVLLLKPGIERLSKKR